MKTQMTTIEKIKTILDSRTFDELVGLKEASWFDAKSKPAYDFSTAAGRVELAKDVSGFANAQGGYLIMGLHTKVLVEESTEVVSNLGLLSKADFDVSKFQGLIREHVYPEIAGLEVTWIESSGESGKGVGVIRIPPQEDSRKFFLMVRVIEDGQQLKQIVFGIAQRVGSSTVPFTITQLYAMTQNGNTDGAKRLTRM